MATVDSVRPVPQNSFKASKPSASYPVFARSSTQNDDPDNIEVLGSRLRTRVASLDNFRPNPDPDYLLRFLRAKKFDVDKAFRSYQKMHAARLAMPDVYFPRGTGSKEVMNVFDLRACAILPQLNPLDDTFVVIVRVGDWTEASGVGLDQAITPILLVGEALLTSPVVQRNGGRLVFDMQGTSVTWARYFSMSAVKTLLSLANGGYPCRLRGFHILHNNAAFRIFFNMLRPFLRTEVVKRVHLHGDNLESLFDHISPDILPAEYGGKAGPFPWTILRDEMARRHDEFVELSYYGYQIGGRTRPDDGDDHSG